jgi:hypothetical protein
MLPKVVPIVASATDEGLDCRPAEAASENTGHAPLAVEGAADGAPLIRIETMTSSASGSQNSRVLGEEQPLATKKAVLV